MTTSTQQDLSMIYVRLRRISLKDIKLYDDLHSARSIHDLCQTSSNKFKDMLEDFIMIN